MLARVVLCIDVPRLGGEGKQMMMEDRASLLIVDDERGPTESLRMVFKSEYDVFTAPSGNEALEILQQEARSLLEDSARSK